MFSEVKRAIYESDGQMAVDPLPRRLTEFEGGKITLVDHFDFKQKKLLDRIQFAHNGERDEHSRVSFTSRLTLLMPLPRPEVFHAPLDAPPDAPKKDEGAKGSRKSERVRTAPSWHKYYNMKK